MSKPILSRWPRLTRLPLALEITLALLLKIAIIFALWYAFFSNPQAKHMLLPTEQVEQHLLTSASDSDSDSTSSTPLPQANRMALQALEKAMPGEGNTVRRTATFTLIQPKGQQHGSD
ncbi:MAG: cytochrome oxidase putative small subunit CydP [Burkholderiaceae bacterium]